MNLTQNQNQEQTIWQGLERVMELTQQSRRWEKHIKVSYNHVKTIRAERRRVICELGFRPWGRNQNLRRLARMLMPLLFLALIGCQTVTPKVTTLPPQTIAAKLKAAAAMVHRVAIPIPQESVLAVPLPPKVHTLLWDVRDGQGKLLSCPYTTGNQTLEFDVEYTNTLPPAWQLYGQTITNAMVLPNNFDLSFWRVGQHFK